LIVMEYFPIYLKSYRDLLREGLEKCLTRLNDTDAKVVVILADRLGLSFQEEKQIFSDLILNHALTRQISLNPVAKTYMKKALGGDVMSPCHFRWRSKMLTGRLFDELCLISRGDIRQFIYCALWMINASIFCGSPRLLSLSGNDIAPITVFFQAIGHVLFHRAEVESLETLLLKLQGDTGMTSETYVLYLFENYLDVIPEKGLDEHELCDLSTSFSDFQFLAARFPFNCTAPIVDDLPYFVARKLQVRRHFVAPSALRQMSAWRRPKGSLTNALPSSAFQYNYAMFQK
jgi:hypothetical protein